jgi:hypothetical protein
MENEKKLLNWFLDLLNGGDVNELSKAKVNIELTVKLLDALPYYHGDKILSILMGEEVEADA